MRAASRVVLGRTFATLLSAPLAAGCSHPANVYRSPAEVLAQDGGRVLDLRLTTGTHYSIRDGRIQNDTLYGVALGRTTAENTQLAIPVSTIASLSSTERGVSVADAAKITLGLVSIAALVLTAALVAALSTIQ